VASASPGTRADVLDQPWRGGDETGRLERQVEDLEVPPVDLQRDVRDLVLSEGLEVGHSAYRRAGYRHVAADLSPLDGGVRVDI